MSGSSWWIDVCTPSVKSGHRNEGRSESRNKLVKTTWASSKNLDTANRQWQTSQMKTDVAECRGTWTSWGSQLSTRHDDANNLRRIHVFYLHNIKVFSRIFQPCIFERVCAANSSLANSSLAFSASPLGFVM